MRALTPDLASRMLIIATARQWVAQRHPERTYSHSVLELALRPLRVSARYVGGLRQYPFGRAK